MKYPIPTTKTAYLVSAGYAEPRATRHVYVETRAVIIPGPGGEAWEFLYKCEQTGEVRRWGAERRFEITN